MSSAGCSQMKKKAAERKGVNGNAGMRIVPTERYGWMAETQIHVRQGVQEGRLQVKGTLSLPPSTSLHRAGFDGCSFGSEHSSIIVLAEVGPLKTTIVSQSSLRTVYGVHRAPCGFFAAPAATAVWVSAICAMLGSTVDTCSSVDLQKFLRKNTFSS